MHSRRSKWQCSLLANVGPAGNKPASRENSDGRSEARRPAPGQQATTTMRLLKDSE